MGDNGCSSDDDEVKDKGNVSSRNCISVPDQEIMDLKIKELILGGRNDESSPVSKKTENESIFKATTSESYLKHGDLKKNNLASRTCHCGSQSHLRVPVCTQNDFFHLLRPQINFTWAIAIMKKCLNA